MRELLQLLRQNKFLMIWPIIVFAVMLGVAAYIVTRPVLGNAIYRP